MCPLRYLPVKVPLKSIRSVIYPESGGKGFHCERSAAISHLSVEIAKHLSGA